MIPAAPSNSYELLEALDLHTVLGGNHVLRGVSLTVRAGETVGLLGRNGMGKTTLLRTLIGLARARSGQVRFRGRDCTAVRTDRIVRLGIGYVPEGRAIFPTLTVRENLVMAARPRLDGQRPWTLERVLNLFPRLTQRLGQGGQQLSGGEQQMLAIGRALMTNPELLILDEATEGLAPLIVREIWQIISQLRAGLMAAIVVDRNFRSVLAHTDRCVVLQKGQAVLSGTSTELAGRESELTALLGV